MVNHKENKKYKFLKHFLAGTFWAALFNWHFSAKAFRLTLFGRHFLVDTFLPALFVIEFPGLGCLVHGAWSIMWMTHGSGPISWMAEENSDGVPETLVTLLAALQHYDTWRWSSMLITFIC
jgi:hypothetical protein